ncbi:1083_t:CDS:1 [Funneliformis geosporum]|uniref:1083_t:CDS:1 n=1 Tax=Funneliformis geosporum TaxID=1117311 RepID=A0A9W4SR27_9GLOM|nr:1083_t:CDS:1 [Funneliformis geosporum]
MPRLENFRLQLFPGIDNWLSDIECLTCDSNINQETFIELARLCKSIKSLNIFLGNLNNPGLFRFIKVQKQLHEIGFSLDPTNNDIDFCSFHQTFRDALTANANTIQHFKLTHGVLFPFSVLSSLVNLKSLYVGNRITYDFWSDLEICSFPNLVKLVTYKIPLEKTARMIENSTSKLIEIIIEYTIYHQAYYDRCIQAICQTCPRLKYFKIIVKMTDDFYKLRDILQNCHYLEGLVIEFPYSIRGWNYNIIKVDEVDNTDSDIDEESEYSLIEDEDDCKILCEILAKYSPMCLYKFKLQNMKTLTTDNLKIFFDNWKDRPPMLLQTMPGCRLFGKHFDLIREYTEKGVIKKYDNILNMEDNYDYFEWK